jgi:hypothetical protein
LSDFESHERLDCRGGLYLASPRLDHRAMDPVSFHKLRLAMQENANPASSLDVLELEHALREQLEACGLFDQIEGGSTGDPDQLAIALCRCAADVPVWEAGHRLERVWAVLRSQATWEVHASTVAEEVMDFEGAMILPDGHHFLTLHVVALRHSEMAAPETVQDAEALAE